MKTNRYLIDFYNHYDEDSRLVLRHGTVEFLTTMRSGRYFHTLARQGYVVDAVELVERNIEIFRQNVQPEEKITIMQGNAMDLSAIPDNKYDVTLLLGVM